MIGLSATIPLERVARTKIYINGERKTLAQIVDEEKPDYAVNAGFFNMAKFTPSTWLVADGKVLSQGGSGYGYAFDGGKIVFACQNNVRYPDFLGGYPVILRDGKKAYGAWPADISDRGRTAIGLTRDGLVLRCVPDMYGSGDFTPEELYADMSVHGCVTAVNLDGGGSTQGYFNGKYIISTRIVHSFLLVWLKKEDSMPPTYTNGNKRTPVFEDTRCIKRIGWLDAGEVCALLYSDATYHVVMYFITGTNTRKVGFIRR